MSKDNPKAKPGLWMSKMFFDEQLSDLKELQAMLQVNIEDAIGEDSNWGKEGSLMMMFEFYSSVTNQIKIYEDAMAEKSKINKKTQEEEHYIDSATLDMLFSLTRLAAVNEKILEHDHRISFKVH
tara:strand:- start:160 stop:534 length:375 start_codon:yes stop_codon:yes gene_type:complete